MNVLYKMKDRHKKKKAVEVADEERCLGILAGSYIYGRMVFTPSGGHRAHIHGADGRQGDSAPT
jgi:hypothetical protein